MKWQPFETIPSDREVLIAYSKANGGPIGHDIVSQLGSKWFGSKWFSRDGRGYPNIFMDWVIIGWMDIPTLPEV